MVLYRKFRPVAFSEVKNQELITDALMTAVKLNRIAHAYLFTGTRGTGKTSTARIFAKAINCTAKRKKDGGEPCNVCDICRSFIQGTNLDFTEIDAASNRGIDDIRELKEKINFSPVMSKYKVYVIDEVHMLTKDAFNALLKTLEEPPEFAVFILATTEIHKVPMTVISRCQRFDFRHAPNDALLLFIDDIAQKEGFTIDEAAKALVADLAAGSFRDCLSILDKVLSLSGDITYDAALSALGIPDIRHIEKLLALIKEGRPCNAVVHFRDMYTQGIDAYQFNKSVLSYLENQLVLRARGENGKNLTLEDIFKAVKEFLKAEEMLRYTSAPLVVIEAAILGLSESYPAASSEEPPPSENTKKQESQQKRVNHDIVLAKKEKSGKAGKVRTPEVLPKKQDATAFVTIEEIQKKWNTVILKVMPFNHHLGSFFSKARPVAIEGNTIQIEVKYGFHKDRIEEVKSREAIAKVFEEIFGQRLIPLCTINPKLIIETRGHAPKTQVFEKKQQIEDNVQESIRPASESSDDELLQEALRIFDVA